MKNKEYWKYELFVPSYRSLSLGLKDVIEKKDLISALSEVNDHEMDITDMGAYYLKEIVGIDSIANAMYLSGWYEDEYSSVEEIEEFIKYNTSNVSEGKVIEGKEQDEFLRSWITNDKIKGV